jgi:hypothetical protein
MIARVFSNDMGSTVEHILGTSGEPLGYMVECSERIGSYNPFGIYLVVGTEIQAPAQGS